MRFQAVLLISVIVVSARGSAIGPQMVDPLEFVPFGELVRTAVDAPVNDYSRTPTWGVDYYDCSNKTNRDYAHPWDCTRFIKCRNGRADDFPCCDCDEDSSPGKCDGSPWYEFEYEREWCTFPVDVDCPKHDLCPGIADGAPCEPESEDDCKCGRCDVEEDNVFEYFWCNITNPEDPSADRQPGRWTKQTCSGTDLWNPEAGANGQCQPDWDSLPSKYQEEYKAIGCWKEEKCQDDGKGYLCEAPIPEEGKFCNLTTARCSCGECDAESNFWHYTCVPQEPKGDPRKEWEGRWNKTSCGEREVYNPRTMSCTTWEELKDGDLEEHYRATCFKTPPPCNDNGTICDNPPNVDDKKCDAYSADCGCGRCVENGKFEHFTCDRNKPVNPFDPWTGEWNPQECGHKEFYNPATNECTSTWEDLDKPHQDHFNRPPCFPEPDCLKEDVTGGRICDATLGADCDPWDRPCNCGRCTTDLKFDFFNCIPSPPVGNPHKNWTGTWAKGSCGKEEFYNPATGKCTKSWYDLDKNTQGLYKEEPCFPQPPCAIHPGDAGQLCPSDANMARNESCNVSDGSFCHCGRCLLNLNFEYYNCEAHMPEGNPHDGWTGSWEQIKCGATDFYNPATGKCTGNWDDLDDETKEHYKKPTCLEEPTCDKGGEICKDVNDEDGCDPYNNPCNCGRCLENVTFAYFDCVAHKPEGSPHDGWTGIIEEGRCPDKHFYDPSKGACVSSWFDLPTPVQDDYKNDKTCVPVPCEEGQDEGWECSDVYYTLFGDDTNKEVRSCAADRFYDKATRGCRPCKEVAGCSTCHSCTVSGNRPNQTVSCHHK